MTDLSTRKPGSSLPPGICGDMIGTLAIRLHNCTIFAHSKSVGSRNPVSTLASADERKVDRSKKKTNKVRFSDDAVVSEHGETASTSSDSRECIHCRIQFWGEDTHTDLYTSSSGANLLEYPLLGSVAGVRSYFSDMGSLYVPVLRRRQNASVVIGMVLIPALDLLETPPSPGRRTNRPTTTTNASQHRIPVYSISSLAPPSNETPSGEVIGEVDIEIMLRIRSGLPVLVGEMTSSSENISRKENKSPREIVATTVSNGPERNHVHWGEEKTSEQDMEDIRGGARCGEGADVPKRDQAERCTEPTLPGAAANSSIQDDGRSADSPLRARKVHWQNQVMNASSRGRGMPKSIFPGAVDGIVSDEEMKIQGGALYCKVDPPGENFCDSIAPHPLLSKDHLLANTVGGHETVSAAILDNQATARNSCIADELLDLCINETLSSGESRCFLPVHVGGVVSDESINATAEGAPASLPVSTRFSILDATNELGEEEDLEETEELMISKFLSTAGPTPACVTFPSLALVDAHRCDALARAKFAKITIDRVTLSSQLKRGSCTRFYVRYKLPPSVVVAENLNEASSMSASVFVCKSTPPERLTSTRPKTPLHRRSKGKTSLAQTRRSSPAQNCEGGGETYSETVHELSHSNLMGISFTADEDIRKWFDHTMSFELIRCPESESFRSNLKESGRSLQKDHRPVNVWEATEGTTVALAKLPLRDVLSSHSLDVHAVLEFRSEREPFVLIGTTSVRMALLSGEKCDTVDDTHINQCDNRAVVAPFGDEDSLPLGATVATSTTPMPKKPHQIEWDRSHSSHISSNQDARKNPIDTNTLNDQHSLTSLKQDDQEHRKRPFQGDQHMPQPATKKLCSNLQPVIPPPLWMFVGASRIVEHSHSSTSYDRVENRPSPSCCTILNWGKCKHIRVRASCAAAIASLDELKRNRVNKHKSFASEQVAFKEVTAQNTGKGFLFANAGLAWQAALEVRSDPLRRIIQSESKLVDPSATVIFEVWALSSNAKTESSVGNCEVKEQETLVGLVKVPLSPVSPSFGRSGSVLPSLVVNGWLDIHNPYTGAVHGKLLSTIAVGLLRQIRRLPTARINAAAIQRWWRRWRRTYSPVCACTDPVSDSSPPSTLNQREKEDSKSDGKGFTGVTNASAIRPVGESIKKGIVEEVLQIQAWWRSLLCKKRTLKAFSSLAFYVKDTNETYPNSLDSSCSDCDSVGPLTRDRSVNRFEDSKDARQPVGRIPRPVSGSSMDGSDKGLTDTLRTGDFASSSWDHHDSVCDGSQCAHSSDSNGCYEAKTELCDALDWDIRITVGKVSGLRELITMWYDNQSGMGAGRSRARRPFLASGVFLTFRFFRGKRSTGAKTSMDAVRSEEEWAEFATELLQLSDLPRISSFNFEAAVSQRETECTIEYLRSSDLELTLWFVPTVTTDLLSILQQRRASTPKGCIKICDAHCPLHHLLAPKGIIRKRVPWNVPLSDSGETKEEVGFVEVAIVRSRNDGAMSPGRCHPNTCQIPSSPEAVSSEVIHGETWELGAESPEFSLPPSPPPDEEESERAVETAPRDRLPPVVDQIGSCQNSQDSSSDEKLKDSSSKLQSVPSAENERLLRIALEKNAPPEVVKWLQNHGLQFLSCQEANTIVSGNMEGNAFEVSAENFSKPPLVIELQTEQTSSSSAGSHFITFARDEDEEGESMTVRSLSSVMASLEAINLRMGGDFDQGTSLDQTPIRMETDESGCVKGELAPSAVNIVIGDTEASTDFPSFKKAPLETASKDGAAEKLVTSACSGTGNAANGVTTLDNAHALDSLPTSSSDHHQQKPCPPEVGLHTGMDPPETGTCSERVPRNESPHITCQHLSSKPAKQRADVSGTERQTGNTAPLRKEVASAVDSAKGVCVLDGGMKESETQTDGLVNVKSSKQRTEDSGTDCKTGEAAACRNEIASVVGPVEEGSVFADGLMETQETQTGGTVDIESGAREATALAKGDVNWQRSKEQQNNTPPTTGLGHTKETPKDFFLRPMEKSAINLSEGLKCASRWDGIIAPRRALPGSEGRDNVSTRDRESEGSPRQSQCFQSAPATPFGVAPRISTPLRWRNASAAISRPATTPTFRGASRRKAPRYCAHDDDSQADYDSDVSRSKVNASNSLPSKTNAFMISETDRIARIMLQTSDNHDPSTYLSSSDDESKC